MSLKTRLDGRSKENSSFDIKDESGEVIATVAVADESGTTLEITTKEGLYIQKPNGWSSQRK